MPDKKGQKNVNSKEHTKFDSFLNDNLDIIKGNTPTYLKNKSHINIETEPYKVVNSKHLSPLCTLPNLTEKPKITKSNQKNKQHYTYIRITI